MKKKPDLSRVQQTAVLLMEGKSRRKAKPAQPAKPSGLPNETKKNSGNSLH
jgi:hypothetical protein